MGPSVSDLALNMRFMVWGLRFRVRTWCLGIGVSDLAFRHEIWGLVLQIKGLGMTLGARGIRFTVSIEQMWFASWYLRFRDRTWDLKTGINSDTKFGAWGTRFRVRTWKLEPCTRFRVRTWHLGYGVWDIVPTWDWRHWVSKIILRSDTRSGVHDFRFKVQIWDMMRHYRICYVNVPPRKNYDPFSYTIFQIS